MRTSTRAILFRLLGFFWASALAGRMPPLETSRVYGFHKPGKRNALSRIHEGMSWITAIRVLRSTQLSLPTSGSPATTTNCSVLNGVCADGQPMVLVVPDLHGLVSQRGAFPWTPFRVVLQLYVRGPSSIDRRSNQPGQRTMINTTNRNSSNTHT